MKNILSIFLLIVMGFQTFQMGIIETDFFIHRDRIAQELCENKDKPALKCHGNCQLKKELEKQTPAKNPAQQSKEIQVFLGSDICLVPSSNGILIQEYPVIPATHLHPVHPKDFFHPPALS